MKTLFIVIKNFIFSMLSITFALFSCGKAKNAVLQDHPKFELPEFRSEMSLKFINPEGSNTFSGSTIIWHENVSEKEIAAISRASKDSRLSKAKIIEYKKNTHEPHMLNLLSEKNSLNKEFDRANDTLIEKSSELWAEDIKNIFENYLKTLLSREAIDESHKKHALEVFELFCEAEIWRFATSPNLVLAKYNARPTPNQLCERFYVERQAPDGKNVYFSGDACTSEPRKSYFKCLWQEGVMRTKLYSVIASGTINGDTKANILRDWTESENGLLAHLLRGTSENSEFQTRILSFGLFNETRFLNALSQIPNEISKKYQDRAYRATFERSKAIEPNGELYQAVSGVGAITSTALNRNLATVGAVDISWFTREKIELHNEFATIAYYLSNRPNSDSLSISDFLFNRSRSENLTKKQSDEIAATFKFVYSHESLSSVFSKRDEESALLVERLKKTLIDINQKMQSSPTLEELSKLQDRFLQVQLDGLKTVLAPNACKSFWLDSYLTYALTDKNTIEVKFKVTDSALWMSGRYNFIDRRSLGCASKSGSRCAYVVVEPERGYIKLKAYLDRPEDFGFVEKQSSSMNSEQRSKGFQDISSEELRGKFFIVEMYQSNLFNVMDFFSVTTKFCNEIETDCIWEGAATLTP